MTSPVLTLHAVDLLSKWGFGDGDVLWDYWWDIADDTPPFADRDALHRIVVEHLVPLITAAGISLDVYRIHTIHNPVRTRSVNGVAIDDRGDNPSAEALLSGFSITLHADQLRALVGPSSQVRGPA